MHIYIPDKYCIKTAATVCVILHTLELELPPKPGWGIPLSFSKENLNSCILSRLTLVLNRPVKYHIHVNISSGSIGSDSVDEPKTACTVTKTNSVFM
jgi:hypothetical protein